MFSRCRPPATDSAPCGQGGRANLLHTLLSTGMRTVALARFPVAKRRDWLAMVVGPLPEDREFAEAMGRPAAKSGLGIRNDKPGLIDADIRRFASAERPLLTQGLREYDALIRADESHDFGRCLRFNTSALRPATGCVTRTRRRSSPRPARSAPG